MRAHPRRFESLEVLSPSGESGSSSTDSKRELVVSSIDNAGSVDDLSSHDVLPASTKNGFERVLNLSKDECDVCKYMY